MGQATKAVVITLAGSDKGQEVRIFAIQDPKINLTQETDSNGVATFEGTDLAKLYGKKIGIIINGQRTDFYNNDNDTGEPVHSCALPAGEGLSLLVDAIPED